MVNGGKKMKSDFIPKAPDFRGKLEISAWVKETKEGKPYITIKVANKVNLFKNEPREEKPVKEIKLS